VAKGKGKRKQPDAEPSGPARVLIVNDEDGASELISRLLSGAGYDVDRADTHDSAIVALNAGHADVVLLDLATGGIGQNLKLLDAVRGHPDERIANARVVLVAHQTNNRLFSWQAGIDSFLLRPFHADELLLSVADVLARPDDERSRHRSRELDAASNEGRTIEARPWETRRF
jgi:DNA-binding response OmpR family regulator